MAQVLNPLGRTNASLGRGAWRRHGFVAQGVFGDALDTRT